MFSRSPNDNLDEIKRSQNFLDEIWDEQKTMQDTINTDHPNFENSEEQMCWQMHENNMVRAERIKRQLDRLGQYIKNSQGKPIPHG